MKKFYASRLTKGNEIFQTKIVVDYNGVYIIKPGIFKNQERFISFKHIASVHIEVPIVWFSTIQIQTTGQETFKIFGFTSSDVKTMKKLIMRNI